MPNLKIIDLQTNFTCGEIDPRLYGRVDLKKYRNAVRSLQNMIVMPQGGITRAPGTLYCTETKVGTTVILVPFQYSLEQNYMIEMGATYFRFFKNEAPVLSGGVPYELAHTYTSDQIIECNFFQSADVLYITHSSHPPRKLTRTSDTAWTLTDETFLDGPYLPTNITTTTLTPSATTGSITITASASLFASTDVGRLVRILHGSTWGYAQITAYTSDTQVSAIVKSTFGGTTAVTYWRLGAFSATTGYPSVAMAHDERLYYACTPSTPDGLWGSKVAEYNNFAPSATDGTVADSNSVYGTLTSDQVNGINWIVSSNKGIFLGTISQEWTMTPGSATDASITPASKSVKPRTNIGSARYIKPLRLNNTVLFVQYMRKKIFEFVYKYTDDDFVSVDSTILAWHLLKDCVRTMCFQQEPFGIVWFVTDTNELVGMTYLRDQEVVALYPRKLGGTDVAVKWAATMPSKNIEYSQLWLVVRRTINGVTKQYIEFVDKIYEADDDDLSDKSDAYFMDCGIKYDGVPETIITGLSHLAGQTVQVLADGIDAGDAVVSAGGTVTLLEPASKVNIGLGNEVVIDLLPIEGQGVFGTLQGQIKRINEIVLRLYQSDLSAWAYYDANNKDKMDVWGE